MDGGKSVNYSSLRMRHAACTDTYVYHLRFPCPADEGDRGDIRRRKSWLDAAVVDKWRRTPDPVATTQLPSPPSVLPPNLANHTARRTTTTDSRYPVPSLSLSSRRSCRLDSHPRWSPLSPSHLFVGCAITHEGGTARSLWLIAFVRRPSGPDGVGQLCVGRGNVYRSLRHVPGDCWHPIKRDRGVHATFALDGNPFAVCTSMLPAVSSTLLSPHPPLESLSQRANAQSNCSTASLFRNHPIQ